MKNSRILLLIALSIFTSSYNFWNPFGGSNPNDSGQEKGPKAVQQELQEAGKQQFIKEILQSLEATLNSDTEVISSVLQAVEEKGQEVGKQVAIQVLGELQKAWPEGESSGVQEAIDEAIQAIQQPDLDAWEQAWQQALQKVRDAVQEEKEQQNEALAAAQQAKQVVQAAVQQAEQAVQEAVQQAKQAAQQVDTGQKAELQEEREADASRDQSEAPTASVGGALDSDGVQKAQQQQANGSSTEDVANIATEVKWQREADVNEAEGLAAPAVQSTPAVDLAPEAAGGAQQQTTIKILQELQQALQQVLEALQQKKISVKKLGTNTTEEEWEQFFTERGANKFWQILHMFRNNLKEFKAQGSVSDRTPSQLEAGVLPENPLSGKHSQTQSVPDASTLVKSSLKKSLASNPCRRSFNKASLSPSEKSDSVPEVLWGDVGLYHYLRNDSVAQSTSQMEALPEDTSLTLVHSLDFDFEKSMIPEQFDQEVANGVLTCLTSVLWDKGVIENLVISNGSRSFEKLDRAIKQLAQGLLGLYLTGNRLRYLPKELGYLQRLQVLNLAKNELSWLPYIGDMNHLITLDLSYNLFQDLPSYLATMPELKGLYVEGNSLKCLPESFRNPLKQQMWVIDLPPQEVDSLLPKSEREQWFRENNALNFWETLQYKSTYLEFDFRKNNISENSHLEAVKKIIEHLISEPTSAHTVTTLIIKHGILPNLYFIHMEAFTNLKFFDLSYNQQLQELPTGLDQLQKLEHFNIRGTSISSLSEASKAILEGLEDRGVCVYKDGDDEDDEKLDCIDEGDEGEKNPTALASAVAQPSALESTQASAAQQAPQALTQDPAEAV